MSVTGRGTVVDEFIDVRGARTHYFRAGTGAPLLYLHDPACASRWLPVHDQLAQHFEVIVPDHLGFGQSDRPEWLEGIDDLVLHYVDLVDALKLETVSVVGVSFGGWLAAELAVLAGHRIRKLILVDAFGLHVDGAPVTDIFILAPQEYQRLLGPPADNGQSLEQHLKGMATLALLAWQPLLHDPKLTHRLDRIRVPTLVLWGEQDTVVPMGHGRAYASGIPGARLETIAECGHVPQFDKPEEFVARVSKFLLDSDRL